MNLICGEQWSHFKVRTWNTAEHNSHSLLTCCLGLQRHPYRNMIPWDMFHWQTGLDTPKITAIPCREGTEKTSEYRPDSKDKRPQLNYRRLSMETDPDLLVSVMLRGRLWVRAPIRSNKSWNDYLLLLH